MTCSGKGKNHPLFHPPTPSPSLPLPSSPSFPLPSYPLLPSPSPPSPRQTVDHLGHVLCQEVDRTVVQRTSRHVYHEQEGRLLGQDAILGKRG